jgi:hypothetical protein
MIDREKIKEKHIRETIRREISARLHSINGRGFMLREDALKSKEWFHECMELCDWFMDTYDS